jgi:hypothetical protein
MTTSMELGERGLVMEKVLESDHILVDAVDPHAGVLVCHHRDTHLIGYVHLHTLEPTELASEAHVTWTELEHGQNILCALKAPLFAYDISGSHLGAKGGLRLFRVVHLLESRIVSDHELPELCTAFAFDHLGHVWTADAEGFVYTHTLEPPTVYRQQLPLDAQKKPQQAVSLCALPPDTDTGSGAVIVAATQTHVHMLANGGFEAQSTPLPEEIQQKPRDILVEIEGTRAGPIPIPSHDEVDYVWQVRCFAGGVVVLLQNSVLVKGRTGAGEWLHIANLPCIMDAVQLCPRTGTLALSHINGDVFVVHPSTPERAPTVLTPRRDAVLGRKADANSHMMCAQKTKGGWVIYAARTEGMVDAGAFSEKK